jgi:hypothetical protein
MIACPRHTRRMVVAVAIVGVLWGGMALKRRGDHCLSEAEAYASMGRRTLDLMSVDRTVGESRGADWSRRFAHWCSQQKTRYERVARYPWLSLGPEPPKPK